MRGGISRMNKTRRLNLGIVPIVPRKPAVAAKKAAEKNTENA